MENSSPANSILSVRVSSAERALLEAASEQAKTSLSDFVRRKSVEAAETEVLERSVVVIPAKQWVLFENWLEREPVDNPDLKRLADKKPTWQT